MVPRMRVQLREAAPIALDRPSCGANEHPEKRNIKRVKEQCVYSVYTIVLA